MLGDLVEEEHADIAAIVLFLKALLKLLLRKVCDRAIIGVKEVVIPLAIDRPPERRIMAVACGLSVVQHDPIQPIASSLSIQEVVGWQMEVFFDPWNGPCNFFVIVCKSFRRESQPLWSAVKTRTP